MARKPIDTAPLSTRLPRDIHRLLGELANARGLSMAMLARIMLSDAVKSEKTA